MLNCFINTMEENESVKKKKKIFMLREKYYISPHHLMRIFDSMFYFADLNIFKQSIRTFKRLPHLNPSKHIL